MSFIDDRNSESISSEDCFKASPYHSKKHPSYFPVYDALFSEYRGKKITFVEVGVLGGGSLFMWRKYFGEQARIIGIDLNPQAKKWEAEGFEIFIGSQSDSSFWAQFYSEVGAVDVVLDDGGHTYEQQIITVEESLKFVKDGGKVVVEDVHTSYMSGFGPKRFSFIKYIHKIIDRINARFDELGRPRRSDIWSVSIFESIVAINVNRRLCDLPTKIIDNGKPFDNAEDFRYQLSKVTKLKKIASKLGVNNVFFKMIVKSGLDNISILTFKAKNYF